MNDEQSRLDDVHERVAEARYNKLKAKDLCVTKLKNLEISL